MTQYKNDLLDNFCHRLIDVYGYSYNQIVKDVRISSSLVADIVVWRDEAKYNCDLVIVVECKAEQVHIKQEDYFVQFRQASLNGSCFYIVHNFKETKVFYLHKKSHTPLQVRCMNDIPSAVDISTEQKIAQFVSKSEDYSKEQFLKILNKCHNIIRNNDKLSPEAAFDEISKILFIKMLYERNAKQELVYGKDKFLKNEVSYAEGTDYIQYLFAEVKKQYEDDGLFDKDDRIKIRRDSFLLILEELEKIALYDTADDIKGIAFEQFLGKTFRGELGQFFTPRTIVNYMVDVLNIKEGDRVCDPCCGSGGFLIKAFERVQSQIDNEVQAQINLVIENTDLSDEKKQEQVKMLLRQCDKKVEGSRYYKLCHDYFFGVDANVRMARTSKMNMIMHGDGHVGVYLHDGFLNVGGVYESRFDAILMNPPFGANVEKTMRITDADIPSAKEKMIYTDLFGDDYIRFVYNPMIEYANKINSDGSKGKRIRELYSMPNSNTEMLFIERCIRLLKPGKRAGIVLPEGVFDNPALKSVRTFIEKYARILNITSIPSNVFLSSGANIKPSLIFIQKKFEHEPDDDYMLSVTKVSDAGISSTGLPSQNLELPVAAKEVQSFLAGNPLDEMTYTKIVKRSDLIDWNVKPIFNVTQAQFNAKYKTVKIGEVLTISKDIVVVEPTVTYTRLTVKLFNRGIVKRDEVVGASIGTKRQTQVSEGQFVISKIDGKSAAFGIIGREYEGAIVTPDFLVYDIDTTRILPDYLEMVLQSESILRQFEISSNGTTGRRRLPQSVFEQTVIALPSLSEQKKLVSDITEIKESQRELEKRLKDSIDMFNHKIFK